MSLLARSQQTFTKVRKTFKLGSVLAGLMTVGVTQGQAADLTGIVLSTVVLVSPADGAGYGSGTFITPYGHILTNHHVIELPDGSPAEHSFIRVSESFIDEPVFRYVAQLVAADRELDLAILKVVADSSFMPIPSVQRFPYLPIGRRSDLRPGQRIAVWGYPGISGRTITSTEGTISGFVGEDLYSSGDRWIKTDAQVAPGNSGGAAITAEGVLVGVPTVITGRALTDEIAVSQNWLRPADVFLEVVEGLPGAEVVSLGSGPGPSPATGTAEVEGPEPDPEEEAIDLDKVVTTSAELMARLPLGGLVTLAEGTFQLTEPINITSSTRIVGDGSDYTFLISSAEDHALRFQEGETFRLEGVTIQHIDGLVADVVQVRGGQTAEFIDVRLMGAVYDEVLDRGGSGLAISGSAGVVVSDSYFGQNAKAGLSISGAADVTVDNGRFDRNQGNGIQMTSGTLSVVGSTFTANAGPGVDLRGSASGTIVNSEFDDIETAIVLRDQAQLVATNLDIKGAPRVEKFLGLDDSRATFSGGTIEGTVRVSGQAEFVSSKTEFMHSEGSGRVQVRDTAVAELTEVTFYQIGLSLSDNGVVRLVDSRIEDSLGSGVSTSGRSNATITNTEIRGSHLSGVIASDSSTVRIENSTIVGSNGLQDLLFTGITAMDSANIIVLDSTLRNNGYVGVNLEYGYNGMFEMRRSEISGNVLIPRLSDNVASIDSHYLDGQFNDGRLTVINNRLQVPMLLPTSGSAADWGNRQEAVLRASNTAIW